MSVQLTLTFIAYTCLTLLLGVFAFRKTQTLADYLLGGRRLGPWTTALSAGASDMSGWLLLGLPGYAYASGLAALWLIIGLWGGTYLNWALVSQRLRVFSIKLDDALTMPSYFERRFEDKSGILRLLSAFFILVFFLFYTSSGLVAGGKLFASVFELPYETAVITATILIVSYTILGGFLAVCWTDLFQALLMLLAVVLVPVMGWVYWQHELGVVELLSERNEHLLNPWLNTDGSELGVISIVSLLAWGLGYVGQPHILARFKAAADPAILPRAKTIAVIWSAVAMLGAAGAGLLGNGLVENLADSETIFMLSVETLFHPIVAGILLAAILAAIMSTADSQLLVSASTLVEDVYRYFQGELGKAEEGVQAARLILMSRLAVAVVACIAMAIALQPDAKVLELVGYAWAGFGAAFGPALLFSLYWSSTTRWGAMAGILVGGSTVVIWKPLEGGLFDLYEIVPAFILSCFVIFIVSRVSPEEQKEQSRNRFLSLRDSMGWSGV